MTRRPEITREHVLAAIKDLESGFTHSYREPRKYVVVFEERLYSPKAVLARAMFHATGLILNPKDFSGGKGTNTVLRRLGFEIRPVTER